MSKTPETWGIPLYAHGTDGGAQYLMDAFTECPDGHREGVIAGATIIVRLDGQPEIAGKRVFAYPKMVAALKKVANCSRYPRSEPENIAFALDGVREIARAILKELEEL